MTQTDRYVFGIVGSLVATGMLVVGVILFASFVSSGRGVSGEHATHVQDSSPPASPKPVHAGDSEVQAPDVHVNAGGQSLESDLSDEPSHTRGLGRSSPAQPGRKLFSKYDGLVVRESASTSSSSIVTIGTGHEFVEISRKDGWVEVGVARTGKTGWVPSPSTTFVQASGGTRTPETDKFRKFMAAFSILNQRVKSQTGIELFSDAEDMGDGILYVNATNTWLSGSTAEKTSSLNTVYKLWQAADGSGLPIAVHVRDAKGNTVMKKSG